MWAPGWSFCPKNTSAGEQVISKLAALLGNDSRVGTCGVAFTHVDRLRQVCEQLHDAGYPGMGREPMYSALVGVWHNAYQTAASPGNGWTGM